MSMSKARGALLLLCLPALLLLAACGGSTSRGPQEATGLAYVDPQGTGWRLVRDATSTPTRLVLNLVGPGGTTCRGVGFNLQAGAQVRFTTFDNGWHANPTGVFELKTVVVDPDNPPTTPEPTFFAAGVKPGNLLTVGIFQKDRRATAKAVTAPVVRIALELDPAAALKAGDPLPLAVAKARILPADIGDLSSYADVISKSRLTDIPVAVGTLSAQ